MESNKKWINVWNIVLILIGAVTLIGLIKKVLDKVDSENIDCDEYDKNLESISNNTIEINLSKDANDNVVVDDVVFSENSEKISDKTQNCDENCNKNYNEIINY